MKSFDTLFKFVNLFLKISLLGMAIFTGCEKSSQDNGGLNNESRQKIAYKPTWESLAKHQTPAWLLDAKFGIYAHWGVYSVPAYETEWYAKRMYQKGSKVYNHHVKTYGKPSKFGYKEFIPMWKAQNYSPDHWAKLIKESGAKYAGFAVVHHDGFLLWDSDISRWNAVNMGPRRDLYGDLVQALRKKGLKTIATFHHIRTYNWYLPGSGGFGEINDQNKIQEIRNKGWDITDPSYKDLYANELDGVSYDDFLHTWQAEIKEVIDNYKPDVIWFDGGNFRNGDSRGIAENLLAYYYNAGEKWEKPVELLNKLPTTGVFNFPREVGMLTFEEGRSRVSRVDWPWIDDMRIGSKAWCYVQGQTYKNPDEIIDGLIDRVARGGGLVLNLSPKADGTFPEAQVNALHSIGKWLKINGEAIYNTRPWKIYSDNDDWNKIASTENGKMDYHAMDGKHIRFTRSKDQNTLYAIVLGWPENGKLDIRHLGRQIQIADGGIHSIALIGSNQQIKWKRDAKALHINLSQQEDTSLYAYALKIKINGKLVME